MKIKELLNNCKIDNKILTFYLKILTKKKVIFLFRVIQVELF